MIGAMARHRVQVLRTAGMTLKQLVAGGAKLRPFPADMMNEAFRASNEIYAAMQTGAMDAAMTSSTSFISFKLEELAKHLTSGRQRTYWFMFEPLLMSKEVFGKLTKPQQDTVMALGTELEKFATEGAQADDKLCAEVYAKAGAKVYDMDDAVLRKWQALARDTAWKDFGERNESCATLLRAAQKLL